MNCFVRASCPHPAHCTAVAFCIGRYALHGAAHGIAALPRSMNWQPIETAPKDGSVFDAWCQPDDHDAGFRIADVVWVPRYGAFFSDADGTLANDITHWRPLPAGPGVSTDERP